MGSSRRRLLNQLTLSRVAYSTASKLRHGPRRWMTSALNRPLIVSASALAMVLGPMGDYGSIIAVADAAHSMFGAGTRNWRFTKGAFPSENADIHRAGQLLVWDRRLLRLSPDNVLITHPLHQLGDHASGNVEALSAQMSPGLAHAVNLPVGVENAPDVWPKLGIPQGTV